MHLSRLVKILLGALLALIVILAVLLVVVATFDWNHAKPWVSKQLSEVTHRQVDIQGDLSVQWTRAQTQQGWQRWVPWPQISAEQVVVGNPEWMKSSDDMARVQKLSVRVNPFPLLGKTVQIDKLSLQGADIALLRVPDGNRNWSLQASDKKNTPPSGWTFDLQKLALQQVSVKFTDSAHNIDVKTDIDSLNESSSGKYGIGWSASGIYNDAKVKGKGRAGKVLALRQGGEPFPLQGSLQLGETLIDIEGSVTQPTALAALDVRLKLKGKTMADLYPLIGVALPNTPPYSTQGRLIGALDTDNDKWTYENFKGRVGASDLQGTLHYLRRKPRSLLSGEVESKLLRLKDLGPLIGIDSDDAKDKDKDKDKDEKKPSAKQPPGKALPVAVIGTDTWSKMDADVYFSGDKIVESKNLPLEDVKAHIILTDSVLTFKPLNFGVAGGNLKSTITLNGQDPTIKASMTASARHMKLGKLLPGAEAMKASLGELHGEAKLTGHGKSFAQLLGTSNGTVSAVISKGTISHLLMETAGLNIANIIMVKLFGDEQVVLNCMASDFNVKDGLMQVQAFRFDTEDAVIDVSGTINLATEHLDLNIKPENKSVRIFTLRTPLYVKGTFKNPDVGVQKGPLVARAGAAIALGIIATPLAALIPLMNLGTDDSNECAALLSGKKPAPKKEPPKKKEQPKLIEH